VEGSFDNTTNFFVRMAKNSNQGPRTINLYVSVGKEFVHRNIPMNTWNAVSTNPQNFFVRRAGTFHSRYETGE